MKKLDNIDENIDMSKMLPDWCWEFIECWKNHFPSWEFIDLLTDVQRIIIEANNQGKKSGIEDIVKVRNEVKEMLLNNDYSSEAYRDAYSLLVKTIDKQNN